MLSNSSININLFAVKESRDWRNTFQYIGLINAPLLIRDCVKKSANYFFMIL
jgi:hypothetical protein